MYAYAESYLKEVVETQGKLFEEVAEYIDHGQAYVCTLDAKALWDYFCKTDHFMPKCGDAIGGFSVNWIGQFYAYFQWSYNISSRKVIERIPLDFIYTAYNGLHDLELDLAVKKVGEQVVK